MFQHYDLNACVAKKGDGTEGMPFMAHVFEGVCAMMCMIFDV